MDCAFYSIQSTQSFKLKSSLSLFNAETFIYDALQYVMRKGLDILPHSSLLSSKLRYIYTTLVVHVDGRTCIRAEYFTYIQYVKSSLVKKPSSAVIHLVPF